MTEPLAYLVAHLREALISDERLHEQAIEIVVIGHDRLELRGEVATPERRDAAITLVRELASGIDVVDDLCVSSVVDPREPELLWRSE